MASSELNKKIMRLHLGNAQAEELKPFYVERNTIELSLDQEIWRIFKAKYLLKDISDSVFTLPQISIIGTGKGLRNSGENPFLDHKFQDDDGMPIYAAYLADYYGACWSVNDLYKSWAWKEFANNDVGILVKTTVQKAMNELCNTNNKFFSLNYYCGKIEYDIELSLDLWKKEAHYTDLIDDQGFKSVKTLLKLPEAYTREGEARLIYNYHNDNDFVRDNVSVKEEGGIKLCRHPFSWVDIFDEIYIDPRFESYKRESYATELRNLSVTCPINWI